MILRLRDGEFERILLSSAWQTLKYLFHESFKNTDKEFERKITWSSKGCHEVRAAMASPHFGQFTIC